MLSIIQSLGYRLQHSHWPFGRRQPSGIRLAFLLFLVGGAASVAFRELLPAIAQLLLWATLLLEVAWLLRHYGRPFLGPVFFYDLVRSSRRGEQVGHRCVYAILLVFVLGAVYFSWFPVASLGLWFSAQSGSTMRASLFALLVAVVFLAVPGALATNSSFSTAHPFQMWQSLLMAYGFSPLDTLEVLTFREDDLRNRKGELLEYARILAAVTGLHFYMAGTAVLWLLTRARLRKR